MHAAGGFDGLEELSLHLSGRLPARPALVRAADAEIALEPPRLVGPLLVEHGDLRGGEISLRQ